MSIGIRVVILAGAALDPVAVTVEDADGVPVAGVSDTVTVALAGGSGGAALAGGATPVAVSGVASFGGLWVANAGSYARFAVQVTFASLSAGHDYACGVATSGPAYCWGDNAYGELGSGTTSNRAAPVAVAGGLVLASVSGGFRTTCGVTRGGQAYCWGSNAEGQLGNGTTAADTALPVPVAGGLTFSAVSVGGAYACGVIASSGAAYCWGYNVSGQLGDGTTTTSSTPVAVLSAPGFASLTASGLFSCGLTAAGAAYCWGYNGTGQLGDGTFASGALPVPVIQ